MNKQAIIEYMKKNNFVPSKKMGQNFLINDNINQAIVKSANINPKTYVLEIGPGFGAITKYINQNTDHLILIELDKRLYEFLKQKYPNINIINDDILSVNLRLLFDSLSWFDKVKVVANVPYSISSQIILKLVEEPNIDEINILVQKEMAQRLLASVNTKQYNGFTALIQIFCEIRHVLNAHYYDFYPAPKVDSWFIKLNKKNLKNLDFKKVSEFLKQCFAYKRKKLFNNLTKHYTREEVINCFKQLHIDEKVRAEQIDPTVLIKLYHYLEQK